MHKGLVALILLAFISLPGCGFKDIDKRFLIVAMGVDQGTEKQYEVTVKLIIPTTLTEPGKSNFQIVSKEADSISEALELMRSDVDKQLDLSHAKVTIFGNKIAQGDMKKHVDWFLRRRGVQRIEYVAVAEHSAKDILTLSQKSERLAGNSLILSFGREGTESSYIITEYLYDFYERLLEKGRDPYLPVIKVRNHTYEINQVALFDKSKIKMVLEPDQTLILNQLMYKHPRFEVNIREKNLKVSMAVHKYNYRYKINTSNRSQPTIDFVVRLRGIAEESSDIRLGASRQEIERAAERTIEHSYLRLLNSLKKNQLDPIGFGLRYIATRHGGHQDWDNWKTLYPRVKFNVKAHVTLDSTGEIK
ncbi:Ger(x)C family spore germination protein [Paenibacillus thiaminolyticus]|uniref:Ger(X)C family spore germination protein n=1 Tax=Paenibacillus thiaminolyticus TaxID=49283 RepID=A0A3A3GDC8_PANTH|nr:Ger(x)C family spore germination protein [Paenibacillus thiaminolyticus]RJG21780.1 Ger(x)C family spore germination protein [Paenibacillus thiaminolyticus]